MFVDLTVLLIHHLNAIRSFFILGAKAEGAAGFFKGVGKGLIGVVARPTGGLVDMASSTFEGLKRFVFLFIH